jgi:hypothetical protein
MAATTSPPLDGAPLPNGAAVIATKANTPRKR